MGFTSREFLQAFQHMAIQRTPCQLEAIGNTGSEGHNHLQMSEQATTALSQKE